MHIDILPVQFLEVTYDNRFAFINSQMDQTKISEIHSSEQHWDIHLFPGEHHMITISTALYGNNLYSEEYSGFLHAGYRYSFGKKSKYDLSLSLRNLLNKKLYHSVQSQGYLTLENLYQIRPRQALLQLRFNF